MIVANFANIKIQRYLSGWNIEMDPSKPLGIIAGKICKKLIPVPEKVYYGNPNSTIAICTLSSLGLLRQIANSDFINQISLVGRLFSENKGIDQIIRYVNENKKIKTIIVCGKDVWGHKAGHSLIKLHQNGIDKNRRIINSISPDPHLTVQINQISYFQKKIILINMINETDLKKIIQLII